MKGQITPELLANCLADISSGRKTIEGCVAAHPAVGEELRSLLDVALAIPALPEVVPDPAFRVRGRSMLIAAINAENNSVTNSPLQRFWRVRI